MTTRIFEGDLSRFLGKIKVDTDVSLTFGQKVLAAICWGCVVGDHIAYLFRTTLAAHSTFNLDAVIGIEVYATLAALLCWRALTTRGSRYRSRCRAVLSHQSEKIDPAPGRLHDRSLDAANKTASEIGQNS